MKLDAESIAQIYKNQKPNASDKKIAKKVSKIMEVSYMEVKSWINPEEQILINLAGMLYPYHLFNFKILNWSGFKNCPKNILEALMNELKNIEFIWSTWLTDFTEISLYIYTDQLTEAISKTWLDEKIKNQIIKYLEKENKGYTGLSFRLEDCRLLDIIDLTEKIRESAEEVDNLICPPPPFPAS
ncbi:MAG: hypothetical protein ACD_3C00194G0007 [uncultured bacterium (gcode 4)]|uniref:Uncharacterized protein n=1 Tax=uncultured bacterium (gcode 4) TaxID=1234023 RepID=K2G065_9BACT|nr:MAG: hypothetical protein ACD_3C00194G0007 [uncultured bacterium (gcode 4)]